MLYHIDFVLLLYHIMLKCFLLRGSYSNFHEPWLHARNQFSSHFSARDREFGAERWNRGFWPVWTFIGGYAWERHMYQFGKGFLLIFMAFQVFKEFQLSFPLMEDWKHPPNNYCLDAPLWSSSEGSWAVFLEPQNKLIWFNAWDTPCSPCRAKRIPESLPEALLDLFWWFFQ